MKNLACGIVLLISAMTVGCNPMSAAKMGYKVVKGVDCDIIPLTNLSHATLQGYDTIVAGNVTTDVNRICTPDVLTEVQIALRERFEERLGEAFPGGGKAVTANVICRFFKKKSIIGSEGRLDLITILADTQSGEELGRFYIEGITESPAHTGVDDMAKGTTKAAAKYIKKLKTGKDDTEDDKKEKEKKKEKDEEK